MSRPKVFTIAPHAPFLPTLVSRIRDGTLTGQPGQPTPFGLADLTVIVPTRRARQALAEQFAIQSGGAAILPDIRTFGETAEDEEPFLPPFDAPPLPPAIRPMPRRLLLARLIEQWIAAREHAPFSTPGFSGFASPPSAAEILALADSLATLIDDCTIENVIPSALGDLDMGSLAENWQQSLQFLSIVLEAWPSILAERGVVDAAMLRNLRLERQAETAPLVYGDRPVIAAGSTGTIPATASLLKAIAALPNGALVLPGLDTGLSGTDHAALLDPANNPHGHPQYGLARLLRRLGTTPGAVTELAPAQAGARTQLIRHALALPQDTASWAHTRAGLGEEALASALAGISIAAARTKEEEARAIALAARDALAHNQSVGILTPDRNLARRIAAELARFGIAVDDSAGTPLSQSRIGRFARQILAVLRTDFAPVDLVALLHNRYLVLSRSRAEIAELTGLIELALLRGQRLGPGLDGLRRGIAANLNDALRAPRHRLTGPEAERLTAFIDELESALAPLQQLLAAGSIQAAQLAASLQQALDALTGQPGNGAPLPQGAHEFRQWAEQVSALPGEGPAFPARDALVVLPGLMAGISVRAPALSREDIAIWGLLEARLQTADLMILAGLNETVWPQIADPGPWLSRNTAIQAGLQPPERRQGQAAHDFEMALGNANTLLTFAMRIDTAPAEPSRLLQRLEAYIGTHRAEALRQKGQVWIRRAHALDATDGPRPAERPMPVPPARLRPRGLSITEIETLIRSPYDLYAKYVLGLRKLPPLGDDPDQAERGTLVHEVFARFFADGHDPGASDALANIMRIAGDVFAGLETERGRRAVWRRRLEKQAEAFLGFEAGRQAAIAHRHVERDGKWQFKIAKQPFTLRGRADRVDQMRDGTVALIDFKTGAVPRPKDMQAFLAPQLLAEALMAQQGAFRGIPPAPVSALTYVKLAAGPDPFQLSDFALPEGEDIASAADELLRRLQRHVQAYLLSATHPMPAHVLPDPAKTFVGDYDHLARMGEWAMTDNEGEGE